MHDKKPVHHRSARSGPSLSHRAHRGVIMIITLIALVVLMIGGVALVRSFDTSMLLSGNLAFKRDLTNQGERGMAQAITLLSTGALANEAARSAHAPGSNYSASVLLSDARGVPNVLMDPLAFTAAGLAGADITDAGSGVTIRYVIDRQCNAVGTFNSATCIVKVRPPDGSGSAHQSERPPGESRPVYRISVRVSGPRNTEAFLQSTVAL